MLRTCRGARPISLGFADGNVELYRQAEKKRSLLRGRTIINCFFSSTGTLQLSQVGGKRLGGLDAINMSVPASSTVKGETLIDTAMTLKVMHPDVAVVLVSRLLVLNQRPGNQPGSVCARPSKD